MTNVVALFDICIPSPPLPSPSPEGIQSGELEDFLTTLLDQEFDTIVDDGSLPQVGGWSQSLKVRLSLVPRPHGKASGLGTLLFKICSAVNEIHSFLRT